MVLRSVAKNEFEMCRCGKRGFADERDADRALGRAQTKRNRAVEATGSRRGLYRENRTYMCDMSDLYHLTSMSRRTHAHRLPAMAMA